MHGLSSFSPNNSIYTNNTKRLHFSANGKDKKDKKTTGEKIFAHTTGVVYGAVTGDTSKKGMDKAGDAWTKISRETDKKVGPVLDKVFGPRKK